MKPSPRIWAAVLSVLIVFAACREQAVNPPPPVRSPPPTAAVVGVVPADWLPGPAVGGRLASHRLLRPDGSVADISLVLYARDSDWLPDGLNSWRIQLGLEELSAGALRESARRMSTPAGPALVFDLEGRQADSVVSFDGRLIAAVIERPSAVWIFRIRGNPELVGQQKQAFLSWVVSVRPDELESPGVVLVENHALESAPAREALTHNVPAPAEIEWQAPADWAPAPGGAGKLVQFTVSAGEAGTAVVSIWGRTGNREQSPLEQIEHWQARTDSGAASPQVIHASAGTIWTGQTRAFRFLEVEGIAGHVLAAWTEGAQATWFFELEGPHEAVRAISPAFAAFLQSATFASVPEDRGEEAPSLNQ